MTVVWAFTWLGQSAALAALTAVFVRLPGCRQSAAARHVAWRLTLFLCAGLLAWWLVPGGASPFPPMPVVAGARPPVSIALIMLPDAVTRLFWWSGWVWALGAAAALALAARDVWRVVRLKRQSVPLSWEEQARLGAGLAAWTSNRVPRLVWCDQLDSPAVLGFSRPVIALPRPQASSLSDAQFRLVVLHELAHVRRGDDWWALAERVVLALAWVNPAIHWVWRELSLSREMACDEWVVRQTAAPAAYARCLADVAAQRTQARRPRLAAGVTGRPGTLRRRIVGVLALDGRPSPRVIAILAWMTPAAVCAVAAGLLQLPPVCVGTHQTQAPMAAPAWSGPAETAARASAGRPAAQPEAARATAVARRTPVARRSSESSAIPAEMAVTLESVSPAPAVPDMAAERAEAAGPRPLAASPLTGSGEPGVTVAAAAPGSYPFQASAARWWSGPVAIGETTGGASAAAGRATASFFTRLGSHIPQLLKR